QNARIFVPGVIRARENATPKSSSRSQPFTSISSRLSATIIGSPPPNVVLPIRRNTAVNRASVGRSGKRLFQRWTLRREHLRGIFSDVQIVFEPPAELAAQVNPRLVAKSHVRRELQRVPANQVRPFVPIHPHSVPHPMREVIVIRPIARV